MGCGFRLTGYGRPSAGKPCSLPRCPNEWQTGTGRCPYARRRIVFTTLHVLGGGTKDRLLCQMAADCCGLTVKAGPVEATALGNIMIQLKALGLLDSITQGRRLIAETEVIKTYTPSTQNYAEWNAAYDRFEPLL